MEKEALGKTFNQAYDGFTALDACITPRTNLEGQNVTSELWIQQGSTSNLFRYLGLWIMMFTVMIDLLTLGGYFIKRSSPIESSLYQPAEKDEFIGWRLLKFMTPWGGTEI